MVNTVRNALDKKQLDEDLRKKSSKNYEDDWG
jgi:hypothetical protein